MLATEKIMERENGYYWVHISDDRMGGDNWEVAFYERGEGWYSIWDGGNYKDNEVNQINETRIVRE